jgi:hypothetical protein
MGKVTKRVNYLIAGQNRGIHNTFFEYSVQPCNLSVNHIFFLQDPQIWQFKPKTFCESKVLELNLATTISQQTHQARFADPYQGAESQHRDLESTGARHTVVVVINITVEHYASLLQNTLPSCFPPPLG